MNKKWFTLIEVLVWVSISTILMISIWALISWWIKNVTTQEKSFDDNDNYLVFENKINDIFSRIDKNFTPQKTTSWVILKINSNFDEGWFTYIWSTGSIINEQNDWVYCLSWSENTNTNHLFIKNFIAFEENTEDIFKNFNEILESKPIEIDWKKYKSLTKKHIIVKEEVGEWKTVVWKWIFWDEFKAWSKWIDIYLNNPTWLAKNWDILFISDTLNNRVLYYDTKKDKIDILLNENDWLFEPTGLLYNISENALYISNSWKAEILKFYSKQIETPSLTLKWISQNNIKEFSIEFFDQNWEKIIENGNNMNKLSIDISDYRVWVWDSYKIEDNKLIFSFSWGTKKNFDNDFITIKGINNFSNTGSYYVRLDINDTFYPFFNQSDNNLLTIDDNKLEIYEKWLEYDTWFRWNKNSRNNFLDWTYKSLAYNKFYDYLLKIPIKEFVVNYDNSLLTLKLVYFSKYDCYNTDEKIEKTFLIKKNFK